jgi:hypothetical protein
MKCKDCIHYAAHKHFYFGEDEKDFDEYFNDDNVESQCPEFEDKKEWLKLPCKVGDTVYYLTGIRKTLIKPAIIKEIIFDTTGVKDLFVSSDTCDFENSFDIFYLTKEEAEKALAERRRK